MGVLCCAGSVPGRSRGSLLEGCSSQRVSSTVGQGSPLAPALLVQQASSCLCSRASGRNAK